MVDKLRNCLFSYALRISLEIFLSEVFVVVAHVAHLGERFVIVSDETLRQVTAVMLGNGMSTSCKVIGLISNSLRVIFVPFVSSATRAWH